MLERYRLDDFRRISLEDYDPEDTGGYGDKAEVKEEFERLIDQLDELQNRLYAGKKHAVLAIFQGMDCSGKDGVVKKVLGGLNPQGIRAESFKKPTLEEADHDFLWRTHVRAPAKGCFVSFNRSYYEEVLVTRVHDTVDDKEAGRRLRHILNFEELLTDSGTVIVKFFLHISKEFQMKKLRERMDNPEKRWKFDPNDLKERQYWKDYMSAYEDAFQATGSDSAPWHIIPANERWFRDLLVLRILVSTLKKLDLAYPEGTAAQAASE
jgi:PPK2 family polyphosphate:nucleotide phosphotransferase